MAAINLHAELCQTAGKYAGQHADAYQTQLFFGTCEEDVEQQMMDWRNEIDCGPGGGLRIEWQDEWIDGETLMRIVAYEPRDVYELREGLI